MRNAVLTQSYIHTCAQKLRMGPAVGKPTAGHLYRSVSSLSSADEIDVNDREAQRQADG